MLDVLKSIIQERVFGHTLQSIDAIFLGILPLVIVGIVINIVLWLQYGRRKKPPGKIFLAMVLAFGVTGCLVGVLVGASREPVVGAALPLIVTLVTGFLTYFMSSDISSGFKQLIPSMIIALVFGAAFGSYFSAIPRSQRELNILKAENLNYPIKIAFCGSLSEKIAGGEMDALSIFEKYECVKLSQD